MKKLSTTALLLLLLLSLLPTSTPTTIPIGSSLGWTDGICYRPINVRLGDVLAFSYGGHDVWRLDSKEESDACDFGNGTKLADVGESPFEYVVGEEDVERKSVYFACSVGSHCSRGNQRLAVNVDGAPDEPDEERIDLPSSQYASGLDGDACALYQSGATDEADAAAFLERNRLQSECTEAVFGEDGMYHVSCLSGPATLTPGGVMNSARIVHYPYPLDRRVVVGTATWEFVEGDPVPNSGGQGVTPVPVNQLYVHHLSGRTILGQGSEGIRRSDVQTPFPAPYGTLTGDEGDVMIFHIIDLREVTQWLACVECRCRDLDGTYLDFEPGKETGGVSCCANCTDLEGPTIDYRMRYNVSYFDVPENDAVTNIQMLTADISPAVGRAIEFDVPAYQYVKSSNVKEGAPHIQRLEREGPFDELFRMEFFGAEYSGPETVKFLRCVGHLHIAAVGMWMEDAESGEMICDGEGSYGQNPEQDKGFLTAIKVHSHDPPLEFPSDRRVRLITEYNATEFHTGVMGMWFAFISSDVEVDREAAALTVKYCEDSTCDADMLPGLPVMTCDDTLVGNPMCQFGGVCECEELVAMEGSEGCGGMYSTVQGSITINDVCAKHCGACGEEGAVSVQSACVDTLADGPMCTFGGLCECDVFVSAPESTGCGGVYASDFGDIQINEYCAKHCGACPADGEGPSQDEMIQKEILKSMEEYLAKECVFATPECKRALSNMHSCSTGQNVSDQNVRAVVMEHGVSLAAGHARLGAASLHRNEEEATVPTCKVTVSTDEDEATTFQDEASLATEEVSTSQAIEEEKEVNPMLFSGIVVAFTFAVLIAGMLYSRSKDRQSAEVAEDRVDKAVALEDTARLSDSSEHASDEDFTSV